MTARREDVDLTYTLEVLWCGLCHLNRIVSKLEEARRQTDPKANELLAMSFDSDCESGDPALLKYFFWYSCSADSFLALFSTTFATEKDSKAFRNMRKFRDKIAAHPCHLQSDPRRKDSEAVRHAALLYDNLLLGISGGTPWDARSRLIRRARRIPHQTGAGS